MKALQLIASLAVASLLSLTASAQSDNHWDKTYSLSRQPTLALTVGDSNLNIKSCGDCKTVRITVDAKNQ